MERESLPEKAERNTGQRAEIILFSVVVLAPMVYSAIWTLVEWGPSALNFSLGGLLYLLIVMVGGLMLSNFLLNGNGLSWEEVGLVWKPRCLLAGAVLFLGLELSARFLVAAFESASVLESLNPPNGIIGVTAFIVIGLLNPVFEECCLRGYFQTNLAKLIGPSTALLLSATVQTSYHLYYGWWGMLTLLPGFILLAYYYRRTNDLTSVIVAHALADISYLILTKREELLGASP